MMDELTPNLARLPEPAPPSTLAATVMARIEREAERREAETASPAPVTRHRERFAWLWMAAGVALVLGVSIYGSRTTGLMPDITSSRIGPGRALLMPFGEPASLWLGLGLLVYLAGLFAPLRHGRSHPRG